jgi:hypothetical protein
MHASDHLIDGYVAGLDLVPVEMAITAAGAAIGAPPIAGAIESQSAVLYCMRQANVERLMARVRSEFADVPTRATLPGLISAMLSSAALFGVTIMTEPEVRLLASEAVLQMETELTELQPAGGLPALNRSVQNDAAAAEVPAWQKAVFLWVPGGATGRWRNRVVILYRISMAALTTSMAVIRLRLTITINQFGDYLLRWVGYANV